MDAQATALNRPPLTSAKQTPADPGSEQPFVRKFLYISVALHIVVFAISALQLVRTPQLPQEEFGIETELISDLNFDTTSKTKIPDVETATEAVVPKNMLPQLPKNFAVDDAAPKETPESLVDPEKTEPAPDIKTSTATGTGTETDPAVTQVKKVDDNKLAQRDALKRLSLELLRQQQKLDNKIAAPETASTSQVKTADTGEATTGAPGVGNLAALKTYQGVLHKAIRRNYNLPSTYKASAGGQLQATVMIKIAANGDVSEAEIVTSSNDKTFDELILQAVRISSPLPKPPENAVDRPIQIVFSH